MSDEIDKSNAKPDNKQQYTATFSVDSADQTNLVAIDRESLNRLFLKAVRESLDPTRSPKFVRLSGRIGGLEDRLIKVGTEIAILQEILSLFISLWFDQVKEVSSNGAPITYVDFLQMLARRLEPKNLTLEEIFTRAFVGNPEFGARVK